MMIVWAAQQRFSLPGPLKKFGAQRQLATYLCLLQGGSNTEDEDL